MTDKVDKKVDRGNNLCCYSQRVCNLEKLKGFHFCHKHILEDKASPFKPCSFIAKSNGKRCTNPAPKMPDKEKSYCIIHTRKAELRRAVEEQRKRKKRTSVDELWIDMEEYRDHSKRRRTTSSTSNKSKDGSQKGDFQSSEEEDMNMDPASGSEELSKVDSAWHGDADSDAESVNSEDEDPLKHAGVWTTEEAVRMCRDKMVRLRSLYIDQFKRLQHVFKEKRRKYLHAIQAEEKNEFGERTIPVSQLLGRRTRKLHGAEALLHKQAKEKRANFGVRYQNMSHPRCAYSPNGNRCTNRILPMTKYCLRHINQDLNQVLFERCTFRNGENQQCEGFVPRALPHTTCSLHVQLPAHTMRTDIQKDLEEAKERDRDRKNKVLEQKVKTELSISLPCDMEQGSSLDSGEAVSTLLQPQKLLMPLGPTPPIIGSKLAVLVPPSEGQKVNEVVETPERLKARPTEPPKVTVTEENNELETTRVIDKETSASSSPTGSMSGIDISPSLAAASIIAVCSPQSSAGEVSICSKSQSALPATSALAQTSANAKMATTSSLVYTSSTGAASVTKIQEDTNAGTPPNTNNKSNSITSIAASSTSSSLVIKDSIQTSAIASADSVNKSSSESSPSTTAIGTFNKSTSICASTAANTTTARNNNAGMTIAATTKIALPVSSSNSAVCTVVSTAEKTQVGLTSVVTLTSANQSTVTNTSSTPVGQSLLATVATSEPKTETKLVPTSAVQLENIKAMSTVSNVSPESVSGKTQVIENEAVQGVKASDDKLSGSDTKTSISTDEAEFQAKPWPSETPSNVRLDCSVSISKVERQMVCQAKEPEVTSETKEKSSPVATE